MFAIMEPVHAALWKDFFSRIVNLNRLYVKTEPDVCVEATKQYCAIPERTVSVTDGCFCGQSKSCEDDHICVNGQCIPMRKSACADTATDCYKRRNYCDEPKYRGMMLTECRDTCGYCSNPKGCKDIADNCASMKHYCTDSLRKALMQRYCRLTCDFCSNEPCDDRLINCDELTENCDKIEFLGAMIKSCAATCMFC
ncbi:unnamed protein product [Enterobius vermicularis]|uniref:ShTK domain protein n=1 Tax=Enterobius vermicularis TaxID=51028 RepID=A0A0N4UTJ9_ENTVE|nr:unnamed protein product [Enterobius vermicularis]